MPYLFRTVDTDETRRAVAIVPMILIAILHTNATVLAHIRILCTRVDLSTFFTAHPFVTVTPAENKMILYNT